MFSHKMIEFNGLKLLVVLRDGDKQPRLISVERFMQLLNHARGSTPNLTMSDEGFADSDVIGIAIDMLSDLLHIKDSLNIPEKSDFFGGNK